MFITIDENESLSGERVSQLMTESKRLKDEINQYPAFPETPIEISMLINLYIDVQGVIAELMAEANGQRTFYEHERKVSDAHYRSGLYGMSEKAKDYACIQHTGELRRKEKTAAAALYKWETFYNAMEQKANALKKHLDVVQDEFNGRGRR